MSIMGLLSSSSSRQRFAGLALAALRSRSFHAIAKAPVASNRWFRSSVAIASYSPTDGIDRIRSLLQQHSNNTIKLEQSLQDNNEKLSHELCQDYAALPPLNTTADNTQQQPRGQVLELLAFDLGTNHEIIRAAAMDYAKNTGGGEEGDKSDTDEGVVRNYQTLELQLRQACTPAYEHLFHHILSHDAKRGLRFLVHLRQDLLQYKRMMMISNDRHAQQRLSQLNDSLQSLLATWFSSETLEIRRITYQQTSAAILEQIATKEAVHPMRSLDDLRTRLGPDKRVYCAFHPWLPDEPLVFVHVALRNQIPCTMSQVLDTKVDGIPPTVACFYSISSTQPGLAGVELGHVLLKKAVQILRQEQEGLNTFCTLSPLPRFRPWLVDKLRHQENHNSTFVDGNFLTDSDMSLLQSALNCKHRDSVISSLLENLVSDPWHLMAQHHEALEPLILKWAARYLLIEKHRTKPLDGVARFHIPNGSILYRLNYMADPSRKGLHQSLGTMVNYHYNLETLEDNRKAHAADPSNIPVEDQVKKLLL